MVSNDNTLVLIILLDSGRNCVPDHGPSDDYSTRTAITVLSDTMSDKFR